MTIWETFLRFLRVLNDEAVSTYVLTALFFGALGGWMMTTRLRLDTWGCL